MAHQKGNDYALRPERPISFEELTATTKEQRARLAILKIRDRNTIQTPHYIALSTRGAVPHVSHDVMRDHTATKGVYTALEDFIERAADGEPPVCQIPVAPHESRLRRFIALHDDALLVLGPRRIPPLPCPAANTFYSMSIVTSVGFGTLESTNYVEAVQKLKPDIVFGMSDVVEHTPSMKRMEKMGDRTQAWLKDLVEGTLDEVNGTPRTALFAPILPIEPEQQSYYLQALQDDYEDSISGLVLYDASSVLSIPERLSYLPRLSVADLGSPHKVLEAIATGIDLFTLPFIGQATDAGIALDFTFPGPLCKESESFLPLGLDMWSPSHATDLNPLRSGCKCFTCANHHRAYLQHLLSAKEMLAWVLLQLHNLHTMDEFFEGIRRAIGEGSFHTEQKKFNLVYEAELPAKTGQGPRVRGYQYKSRGRGEPRKNPPPYGPLDDGKEKVVRAPLPSPDIDAHDMEMLGFAEELS